jgi:hypothetical protein
MIPAALHAMAFSQVSRSLELKKNQESSAQHAHHHQQQQQQAAAAMSVNPTHAFKLDNAEVFSFIATAKSSAIDDVCDDLAETFFQQWDDCTVRIKTIVQTMEEIYPSSYAASSSFAMMNENMLASDTEKNILNNPHASISEYKNVIQSLSRKLVIIQRNQHDAVKVAGDLQTEYHKCQSILENVAQTSARNLNQLEEQVSKFKASYSKAYSWIQEVERLENILQVSVLFFFFFRKVHA